MDPVHECLLDHDIHHSTSVTCAAGLNGDSEVEHFRVFLDALVHPGEDIFDDFLLVLTIVGGSEPSSSSVIACFQFCNESSIYQSGDVIMHSSICSRSVDCFVVSGKGRLFD